MPERLPFAAGPLPEPLERVLSATPGQFERDLRAAWPAALGSAEAGRLSVERVAVPVFLFVGSVMNSAGISKYIYKFADTVAGRLPGGLAQVNIFGSLIFAGMSGSALADIGGIGRIEIDAMRSKGFNPAFAGAVTASSALGATALPAAERTTVPLSRALGSASSVTQR